MFCLPELLSWLQSLTPKQAGLCCTSTGSCQSVLQSTGPWCKYCAPQSFARSPQLSPIWDPEKWNWFLCSGCLTLTMSVGTWIINLWLPYFLVCKKYIIQVNNNSSLCSDPHWAVYHLNIALVWILNTPNVSVFCIFVKYHLQCGANL